MAAALETDLIRLQCYEGLDITPRGLRVGLRAAAARAADSRGHRRRSIAPSARRELYSERFLIKRPLLQAIDPARTRPAVLLIDEIDRADEEFEGYLLELLAEFQITIPELGTVRAVAAAARDPHLQPHARGARRAEAPLPLSVDRVPAFEKELAIVQRARAARVGAARRAGHGARAGARGAGAVQGARRVGDARLGGGAGRARPRHARRGRRRTTRSASLLKARDDIEADPRRARWPRCSRHAGAR